MAEPSFLVLQINVALGSSCSSFMYPGMFILFMQVTDYTRDLEEMQNMTREEYLASLRRCTYAYKEFFLLIQFLHFLIISFPAERVAVSQGEFRSTEDSPGWLLLWFSFDVHNYIMDLIEVAFTVLSLFWGIRLLILCCYLSCQKVLIILFYSIIVGCAQAISLAIVIIVLLVLWHSFLAA